MRELEYKNFSAETHRRNWRLQKPNQCQFELTFCCGLHCRHCYTECYNRPEYLRRQLGTSAVLSILNKVRRSGVLWLCLTGGDPLMREDFSAIYRYAKRQGFLISVFTNGTSITPDILTLFIEQPPFVVEVTLNAMTQKVYESISGVRGSFKRALSGIDGLLKAGLSMKFKTQLTKDNIREFPLIRRFAQERGCCLQPSALLYPRLNGDAFPCSLRVAPNDLLRLQDATQARHPAPEKTVLDRSRTLFPCAVSDSTGFSIDPEGNMFLCNTVRAPLVNVVRKTIPSALRFLSAHFSAKERPLRSVCSRCPESSFCALCPGIAYLETGSFDKPVKYYCRLARSAARRVRL